MKSTWDAGNQQKSQFSNMFATNDFFSKSTPSSSTNMTGNNIIQGSNNAMKGTDNKIAGDQNKLIGKNNTLVGSFNDIFGLSNTILGNQNKNSRTGAN